MGGEAVSLRPASTIMVVRDRLFEEGPALEVLMLQRNVRSEFAGGFYVFPGGAVDAADEGPEALALCEARSDADASALLGVPSGGLAYWVAGLRECFEEAGVLLGYRAAPGHDGEPALVSMRSPDDERRYSAHRQALNEGARDFVGVCAEEGLRLAVDRVHYFAHWITPVGAPRRYDTRFFVAAAPPEQTALHDAGETVEHLWTTPAEALRRHRDGEIELVLPTIRNLQAIHRFATTAELLAAAQAAAARVPTVEPRVVLEGNGVRIVLPGDPGYEEVTPVERPPSRDPAAMNGAMRAIARAANPSADEPPPEGPLTVER